MRLSICSRTIAVGSLLFLVGCAVSPTAPDFSQAKADSPKEGHALVYVYRVSAQPYWWPVGVTIDGTEVASLPDGGFTWVHIKPGQHTIKAVWPILASQQDATVVRSLASGESYFFEVLGESGYRGSVYSKLKQISTDQAQERMKQCCRFVQPSRNEFD